jgi:hypothetical protein
MANTGVLSALIICALMGMIGQGIRAAVGLKSAATLNAQGASQQTQFDAAYFALSLMLGAVAGVLGGFGIGLDTVGKVDPIDTKTLLALAACGYGGVDFIENAFTNLIPSLSNPVVKDGATPNANGTTTGAVQTDKAVAANSVTTDDIRKAANAAATLVVSMQNKFNDLGNAPLTILHQAADGREDVKSLLATAVDSYSKLSAIFQSCAGLTSRAKILAATSDTSSPEALATINENASKLTADATQASNSFDDALSSFKAAQSAILRQTAKG